MRSELKALIDDLAAQTTLSSIESDSIMSRIFDMATCSEERREAGAYLVKAISRRKRLDMDVKGILGDTAEALNLSYIAKRYFGKDRTWLYQRLNHSIVNGKPTAFTDSELKVLSDSLAELSNKIHNISVQLTH